MVLTVEEVFSGYQHTPVIQGVSFELNPGEIMGLVGLNGAGKSTLLKTILGLLPIQSGRITIKGHEITQDHQAYAQQVAYIPETPILYEGMTLREHLEMTALGYGIAVDTVMERAQPLLKLFRLDKHLEWFPVHFSKGMRQKVMIICAMVTNASVYIIDEPFLGLDPLAIRDFTQLLQEKADQGVAILLTTHILSIAPTLCDRYLLLQAGKLRGQGNLDDLRKAFDMPQASLDDIYIAMTNEVTR